MYRSRNEFIPYKKHTRRVTKAAICEFCIIEAGNDQFVEESEYFKVIKNIFPYTKWDLHKVENHLMIIPKKHILTLADVSDSEAADFVRLVSRYEKGGYDVFARAPDSKSRSVPHQHTHLIKPKGKPIKGLFYISRPYFRLMR